MTTQAETPAQTITLDRDLGWKVAAKVESYGCGANGHGVVVAVARENGADMDACEVDHGYADDGRLAWTLTAPGLTVRLF